MKEFLFRLFSSYKTAIVMMLLYACVMAIATFIEKFSGTETARVFIYYSPVFILLQLLLVVNFIFIVFKYRLLSKKKWGSIAVHAAFIIILAGALTTHLSGKEGYIHLREGEPVSHMLIQTNKGNYNYDLPFSIKLMKFEIVRYPGSSSPSSYQSSLLIHADGQFSEENISMNKVLDIKGYRLFQASYDKDEMGTILSVNKDVAGRNITYSGYFLLLTGFILFFFDKNSRFRHLIQMLGQGKQITSCIILFLLSFPVYANAQSTGKLMEVIQKNKIPEPYALEFGSVPMQSPDGRIEPVNTFSSEVLRKLHHSDKITGLNSDQFLLSVLTLPEMWMNVPVIAYSNNAISFNFDITEKMCSYVEFFDTNGNYKLRNELNDVFSKPLSERTRFDKDLIKLDEQVNIFHQLLGGKLINIFPNEKDINNKWYSYGDDLSSFSAQDSLLVKQIMENYLQSLREGMRSGDWETVSGNLLAVTKFQNGKNKSLDISASGIGMEILYNKLDIFRTCKIAYLILGALFLILSFICTFRNHSLIRWLSYLLIAGIIIVMLYHLSGIVMRWIIAGYAPWSNSYETMIYVSLITVIAGAVFMRRSKITFALATLFAGVILFVSGLSWMDPQISPLVPVLKSRWLMIHVAVIVAAYGFFGISFLLGTTNLVLLRVNKKNRYDTISLRVKELCIINEISLWIGLALMTIGTFVGAVWANESWGRYWGWDPKETWALITIIIYAIVTHMRLVKGWDNPHRFNLLSVLAFFCVLMTYFGVNYFLSGMHSYG